MSLGGGGMDERTTCEHKVFNHGVCLGCGHSETAILYVRVAEAERELSNARAAIARVWESTGESAEGHVETEVSDAVDRLRERVAEAERERDELNRLQDLVEPLLGAALCYERELSADSDDEPHALNALSVAAKNYARAACAKARGQAVVATSPCERCRRTEEALAEARSRFTAPVVCICGSTKFKQAWIAENARLTGEGNIVLAVGLWGHHERVFPDDTTKARLDDLHKRKIDLCDWVWVLDVGGYIGASTRSEIEYAERIGRPVRYLSREFPAYTEPIDEVSRDLADARGLLEVVGMGVVPYRIERGGPWSLDQRGMERDASVAFNRMWLEGGYWKRAPFPDMESALTAARDALVAKGLLLEGQDGN